MIPSERNAPEEGAVTSKSPEWEPVDCVRNCKSPVAAADGAKGRGAEGEVGEGMVDSSWALSCKRIKFGRGVYLIARVYCLTCHGFDP